MLQPSCVFWEETPTNGSSWPPMGPRWGPMGPLVPASNSRTPWMLLTCFSHCTSPPHSHRTFFFCTIPSLRYGGAQIFAEQLHCADPCVCARCVAWVRLLAQVKTGRTKGAARNEDICQRRCVGLAEGNAWAMPGFPGTAFLILGQKFRTWKGGLYWVHVSPKCKKEAPSYPLPLSPTTGLVQRPGHRWPSTSRWTGEANPFFKL